MLQASIRRFLDTIRSGLNTGFVAGLVIVFLILLGIPVEIENIALFSLFLVVTVAAVSLARRLREKPWTNLIKNSLALGAAAALIVLLFMSLINRWQARGIDVKQYFDKVNAQTVYLLSGVPEEELFANPTRDPLTGEYPEGEALRTSPMRLTFEKENGLRLFKLNLRIGGFYGFLLLLILVSVVSAILTRLTIQAELGRYRQQMSAALSGNAIAHWVILLLPLLFFLLLWISVPLGNREPILSLGSSAQELQLMISFGIILWGLVALRAVQPSDWNLSYYTQVGIVLSAVAVLTGLGLWHVMGDKMYFLATSDDPNGSRNISIAAMITIGLIAAAVNLWSLRSSRRFETQFTSTTVALALLLMPLYLDQFQNSVLAKVGIYVLLGLGLNIVIGYAGILNLGYVAFFAMGAYTYAFLSSDQQQIGQDGKPTGLKFAGNDDMVMQIAGWMTIAAVVSLVVVVIGLRMWRQRQTTRISEARPTLINLPERPSGGVTLLLTAVAIGTSVAVALVLQNSGLYKDIFGRVSPFFIGLIVGVLVSAITGIVLCIPVLRLRGDYLAIVTLGFAEIIRLMFNNLRDYTGGPQGVLQIPRPLPDNASGTITNIVMLYLVFLGAALVAFFSARLRQGRIGRAWNAVRSDEDIAQSMGIDLVQTKLLAFAIGAAFAGLGGMLFAARQRNIFPNDFDLSVSIEVLSLVIIGGMGSIPGVIMGAIALIGIPEVLRELETYRILVFGALLVVMVIIRPTGLLPMPLPQLRERAESLAKQFKPKREEQA
ncbi:MAG: hypothetical protein HY866_00580 [Chloroflexi bacterium]|nr:hypothetical protein [Chloroflexota bacterium]